MTTSSTQHSEFSNRRILITGATKGLGWVCAEYFESMGAQLIVTGRTPEKLQALSRKFQHPDKHLYHQADLLGIDGVTSLVEAIHEFCGGVDVIVHSLGGGYGFRSTAKLATIRDAASSQRSCRR